jgi:hypothetical protein
MTLKVVVIKVGAEPALAKPDEFLDVGDVPEPIVDVPD